MFFDTVRNELLKEAKASPMLLSDLAGLEGYVAESYHNRSFIELLQNADDAESSKFKILKTENFLFVANDGKTFDQQDLESLCRSASSNKVRGKTIGYRGIGFKSVVGFAKEIHIISGELELTFSKTKTQQDLNNVDKVPLIRIPHYLSEVDKKLIEPTYRKLQEDGYSTVFVFGGLIANEIESEFNSFEYNSLLFIRNITKTDICISSPITTLVEKKQLSPLETEVTLNTNKETSKWLISQLKTSSIAFKVEEEKIIKQPAEKSHVHAFLPTEDSTGLGVLINGNFSTDPSRRHIIFDEKTEEAIKLCSEHIVKIIFEGIKMKGSINKEQINALTPYSDPRMLLFKKNSFDKSLLNQLKLFASSDFNDLLICPKWFNSKDCKNIFSDSNLNLVNPDLNDTEGFSDFLKYLGAKEIDFDYFIPNINKSEISILGCVQLTKIIFQSHLSFSKYNESVIAELKVLHADGERTSLNLIKEKKLQLDDSFIQLLLENGLTESDITQVLKKYSSEQNINTANPSNLAPSINEIEEPNDTESSVNNWFNQVKETKQDKVIHGIKRWRSAEEQTLQILNANGFNLEDVSKQNIGYDIAGTDPNGNEIQIEIKSITLPGQKFKLTNNEVAVAQEKGNSFYVAVVRQIDDKFEIALISDPVNNLSLSRQCVQWIWECENYEYNPKTFNI